MRTLSVDTDATPAFAVRLDNFEGPFDLLLSLISKHKLDITEVALATVTDEFIAFVKAGGPVWDLEQTTSFLLIASTLLDLKAARLLPQGDVEDEEDLALLEARDLLFARLLQYKAFKQVAGTFERRLAAESLRHPRAVGLEDRFATLLPEVLIGIGLEQFAALAAKALEPKTVEEVSLHHIHAPAVSVREQAALVVDRLRRTGTMTFRALCGDSPDVLTTVARFLALLELFREGAVGFDQVTPLGELTVRWTGAEDGGDRDHRRVRRGAEPTTRHPRDRAVRPAAGGDDVTEQSDTLAVAVADLRPALEAILMVADEPQDQVALASAVGYPVAEVEEALAALAEEYTAQGRGFELRNVAGGWRYYTREEYAGVVEGFVLDGQRARLTQAALETLAVVAYKQPVSRARVSAIRGVNVDGVMRTLVSRGLVEEAGQDGEHGATLYRTTGYFLERIGVTSLEELPELAPYLPDMEDFDDELTEALAAAPSGDQAAHPAHHPAQHAGPGTEPDGGTEVG